MRRVFVGVDTHAQTHVAVALDHLGKSLGSLSFASDVSGYSELLSWSLSLGILEVVGVEGIGSYGAGLSRFLRSRGVSVVEVARPNRQHRRRHGKSDHTDALSAARSILAGSSFHPKSADGCVESIRVMSYVRSSAVKARTQARNQIHALLVTAPESLREELARLSVVELLDKARRFRISGDCTPKDTAKLSLKILAYRHRSLSSEIAAVDDALRMAVQKSFPELLGVYCVGVQISASLLIAIGDNPERLLSEAAFASLCGVCPVEASSGKTVRHRLNRGGNRDANRALHLVAVLRMAHDSRTKDYVLRRTREGKSKKEIIRCLKRYIAREVYKVVMNASKNVRNSS